MSLTQIGGTNNMNTVEDKLKELRQLVKDVEELHGSPLQHTKVASVYFYRDGNYFRVRGQGFKWMVSSHRDNDVSLEYNGDGAIIDHINLPVLLDHYIQIVKRIKSSLDHPKEVIVDGVTYVRKEISDGCGDCDEELPF